MPLENGSVTPRVAAAATAASTALPPRRSTSRPVRVAVASTVATAPPYPTAVARAGGDAVAADAADGMSSGTTIPAAASSDARRIRMCVLLTRVILGPPVS